MFEHLINDLPPGFDGVPQVGATPKRKRSHLNFCGLELHRYPCPNAGRVVYVGNRRFDNGEPTRLYEITICNDLNDAYILEDAKLLASLECKGINRRAFEYVCVSTLHAILRDRCRRNGTRRAERHCIDAKAKADNENE